MRLLRGVAGDVCNWRLSWELAVEKTLFELIDAALDALVGKQADGVKDAVSALQEAREVMLRMSKEIDKHLRAAPKP